MKCRVCNNLTNEIYETPKLPEYIWPNAKKIKIRSVSFHVKNVTPYSFKNFQKKNKKFLWRRKF